MKTFYLLLVATFAVGTAAAFAMNYSYYGYRDSQFGPLTLDGTVTAENAMAVVDEGKPQGLAKAEVIGGTRYNFGVMTPDEHGEHVFVVKNVGSEDLTLRVGASTCKCTVGSLTNDSLAPGEQAEVKLAWHIQTNSDRFGQSAELLTNDPSQPAIRLEIEGEVVRQLEMIPKEWTFGEVAAGEPIELESRIYNFMEHDIAPTRLRFSDEALTELAEFEVQPYEPTEAEDGARADARQAFKVKVTIQPGLKQGPVSQNFQFGFQQLDGEGNPLPPDGETSTEGQLIAATTGRIIGSLSMIVGSRLTGVPGGGYVYDFGRLEEDDRMTAKTFVVLKGSERDNTTLRIGKVEPEGVIRANLEEGATRGSMVLYTLSLELVPGEKPTERLGRHSDDYGRVWIESDNPKVPPLQIAIKFAIPGKS